jgi:hypothetical protein
MIVEQLSAPMRGVCAAFERYLAGQRGLSPHTVRACPVMAQWMSTV